MQNIKSKVPYPCTGCPRNGKQSCMDKHCARWQEWFKGDAWKEAVAKGKAYLERRGG